MQTLCANSYASMSASFSRADRSNKIIFFFTKYWTFETFYYIQLGVAYHQERVAEPAFGR